MAGGPTVNLVIAFALFAGVFGLYGTVEPTTTVGQVSECVVPAEDEGRDCTAADPRSPAASAGILPGDQMVVLQRHADRRLDAAGQRSSAHNESGTAIDRGRARRRAADAVDEHHGEVGPLARPRRAPSSRAASSACQPDARRARPTGCVYTADQMRLMTWDVTQALGSLPVKVWHVGLAVVGVEEPRPRTAR